MYWFRGDSPLPILIWLLTVLLWWAGGWLVVSHAFKIERRARLVAGLGVGLVSYLWIVNFLGRWLIPETTFLLGAALVFLLGLGLARGRTGPLFDRQDFQVWPQLFGGLVLSLVFTRLWK
jgi:hypothetical protein